jgi:Cft2 family RNA processing exonuclease
MMTEHTLSNIIAPHFLPNPAHGIFFVGYADPDSPAGRLRSAKQGDSFQVAPDIHPETLRCRVETFGFSAHGDRDSLVDYIQRAAPKQVILVHGDPDAQEWMRQTLSVRTPGTRVLSAPSGVPLDL